MDSHNLYKVDCCSWSICCTQYSLFRSLSPSHPLSRCSVFLRAFVDVVVRNESGLGVLKFLSLPSWFCIGRWNVKEMQEGFGIIAAFPCDVVPSTQPLVFWGPEIIRTPVTAVEINLICAYVCTIHCSLVHTKTAKVRTRHFRDVVTVNLDKLSSVYLLFWLKF